MPFGGGRVGEVGHLQRLRREAAPVVVRRQPRVPLSYEPTAANAADVCVAEELLAGAASREGVAKRPLGDLASTGARTRGKPWPRSASFWRRSGPSDGAG
jgi:hypothetical protein